MKTVQFFTDVFDKKTKYITARNTYVIFYVLMYLSVFSVKFCNSDVAITTHKFRDQTDFRIQRCVVRFAN
jgi:hypothetical protein